MFFVLSSHFVADVSNDRPFVFISLSMFTLAFCWRMVERILSRPLQVLWGCGGLRGAPGGPPGACLGVPGGPGGSQGSPGGPPGGPRGGSVSRAFSINAGCYPRLLKFP